MLAPPCYIISDIHLGHASPDTERLLAGMGYHLDLSDETWGQAAGILVGGKSLAEIGKGGGARYNGAIDSRAAAGEAQGY